MRHWTDEEIEKSVKKVTVGLKIFAKKKGMTIEELFERFFKITEAEKAEMEDEANAASN